MSTSAERMQRMRARIAEAQAPPGNAGPPKRDVSQLLWPAVSETLASLDLKPEDAAAKKLAQRYAQVIDALPDKALRGAADQAWGMRWIGPLLLDTLNALGATPQARAQQAKGVKTPDAPPSGLAKLRAAN